MTHSTADWVSVRYEDVSEPQGPRKRDVTVRFMTSPLDVPEMWRHSIELTGDGRQELVCEFKYLATKEPLRSFEQDGVRFEVGKNSKRVYRLSFPLPNSPKNGDRIALKFELAVEDIHPMEKEAAMRPTHWDVIKNVLTQPNLQMV